MLIEITGAGFSNKGAQLMLATVCSVVKQWCANARFCAPLSYQSFSERAHYGLQFAVGEPPAWRGLRGTVRASLFEMLGRTRLADSLGLVHEADADALIDVSGYGFGDKWPLTYTVMFVKQATRFRRRGKPVVMLPQMLGPFHQIRKAEAFRSLTKQVDLLYAREPESLECASALIDESCKLRMAPDITISTPPAQVKVGVQPYVCIVPNCQLLKENPQCPSWGKSYIDRLVVTGNYLLERGYAVKIVQHEYGREDGALAREIESRIGSTECGVYSHFDPQVLKGVLGGAVLTVGSRFHSLVSALSMGVPAIALGWAHKYDALLRDFGTPELVHGASDKPDHLNELVDYVLTFGETLRGTLLEKKETLVKENERMWDEVLTLLPASSRLQKSDADDPTTD